MELSLRDSRWVMRTVVIPVVRLLPVLRRDQVLTGRLAFCPVHRLVPSVRNHLTGAVETEEEEAATALFDSDAHHGRDIPDAGI